MTTIGYARVSTDGQTLDAQQAALRLAGAEKVYSEAPWWASAPIALTAGIVGVPSLIALLSVGYIAKNVTAELKQLSTYNESEISLLHEAEKVNEGIIRFIEADLRVQYKTCINASKTDEQKESCITAAEREKELGLDPGRDGH